ncbi:hypothetical protein [Yaniella flava]
MGHLHVLPQIADETVRTWTTYGIWALAVGLVSFVPSIWERRDDARI